MALACEKFMEGNSFHSATDIFLSKPLLTPLDQSWDPSAWLGIAASRIDQDRNDLLEPQKTVVFACEEDELFELDLDTIPQDSSSYPAVKQSLHALFGWPSSVCTSEIFSNNEGGTSAVETLEQLWAVINSSEKPTFGLRLSPVKQSANKVVTFIVDEEKNSSLAWTPYRGTQMEPPLYSKLCYLLFVGLSRQG